MIRTAAAVLALAVASPAWAQVSPVEGNWGCRALIDGTRAGLLTIYAGSYGYASANFGSAASGTGNVQMYSDGVQFLDGSLIQGAGIEVGALSFNEAGLDTLTLATAEKPILVCVPR